MQIAPQHLQLKIKPKYESMKAIWEVFKNIEIAK